MKRSRITLLALLISGCAHQEEGLPDALSSLADDASVVTQIRRSGLLRLVPADPSTPYRR